MLSVFMFFSTQYDLLEHRARLGVSKLESCGNGAESTGLAA